MVSPWSGEDAAWVFTSDPMVDALVTGHQTLAYYSHALWARALIACLEGTGPDLGEKAAELSKAFEAAVRAPRPRSRAVLDRLMRQVEETARSEVEWGELEGLELSEELGRLLEMADDFSSALWGRKAGSGGGWLQRMARGGARPEEGGVRGERRRRLIELDAQDWKRRSAFSEEAMAGLLSAEEWMADADRALEAMGFFCAEVAERTRGGDGGTTGLATDLWAVLAAYARESRTIGSKLADAGLSLELGAAEWSRMRARALATWILRMGRPEGLYVHAGPVGTISDRDMLPRPRFVFLADGPMLKAVKSVAEALVVLTQRWRTEVVGDREYSSLTSFLLAPWALGMAESLHSFQEDLDVPAEFVPALECWLEHRFVSNLLIQGRPRNARAYLPVTGRVLEENAARSTWAGLELDVGYGRRMERRVPRDGREEVFSGMGFIVHAVVDGERKPLW